MGHTASVGLRDKSPLDTRKTASEVYQSQDARDERHLTLFSKATVAPSTEVITSSTSPSAIEDGATSGKEKATRTLPPLSGTGSARGFKDTEEMSKLRKGSDAENESKKLGKAQPSSPKPVRLRSLSNSALVQGDRVPKSSGIAAESLSSVALGAPPTADQLTAELRDLAAIAALDGPSSASPSASPASASKASIAMNKLKKKTNMIAMLNTAFSPKAGGLSPVGRQSKDMTPQVAAAMVERIQKTLTDPTLVRDASRVTRFLKSVEFQAWSNEQMRREAVSGLTRLKQLWLNSSEDEADADGDDGRGDLAGTTGGEKKKKKSKGKSSRPISENDEDIDHATEDYFITNFVATEVRSEIEDEIKHSKTRSGRMRVPSEPVPLSPMSVTHKLKAIEFIMPGDLQDADQSSWEDAKLQIETEWSPDIFKLSELCRGRPIVFVGAVALAQHNLIERFHIPRAKLSKYLNAIEDHYLAVKYHNSTHGADVCASVNILLWNGVIEQAQLNSAEVLAALVAGLVHDVGHPGYNNNFMVHTANDLALRYNDKSPLENMHVAEAFRIMRQPDKNIFETLSKEEYHSARTLMINMILATDGAVHFTELSAFKSTVVTTIEQKGEKNPNFRSTMMKMVLHAADISNPAKNTPLAIKWTELVMEEFFEQGDKEKELNVEVSPLCDRATTVIPKSQVGFIDVIVKPCFDTLLAILPETPVSTLIRENLVANKAYWQTQVSAATAVRRQSMKAMAEKNAGGAAAGAIASATESATPAVATAPLLSSRAGSGGLAPAPDTSASK